MWLTNHFSLSKHFFIGSKILNLIAFFLAPQMTYFKEKSHIKVPLISAEITLLMLLLQPLVICPQAGAGGTSLLFCAGQPWAACGVCCRGRSPRMGGTSSCQRSPSAWVMSETASWTRVLFIEGEENKHYLIQVCSIIFSTM